MKVKLFELRDRGTFVPVLCVLMQSSHEQEHYLLRRSGYGEPMEFVLMTGLDGGLDKSACDPHDWSNRTRLYAHDYIQNHWDELESGQVIDVEFILGESTQPKQSERLATPHPHEGPQRVE